MKMLESGGPSDVAENERSNYIIRMQISIEILLKRIGNLTMEFPFLAALESHFREAGLFLVGGAVRDLLLGRETKDYDFLVQGVPAPDLEVFLKGYGKVNWVGRNFGVYKFVPGGGPPEEIDVALPRKEHSFSYSGGYRDFDVQSDPNLPIEEDLRRRDFTINAMAVDLRRRHLIDPFGGVADLQRGLLRAVGEPSLRFSEDYSRLLRGLRFACQFSLRFEDKTWKALLTAVPLLNAKREDGGFVTPRETIAKEWIKAMVADPVCAFDLWDKSGAFAQLIPELLPMKGCPQPVIFHSEGDVWTHTRLALAQLASPEFREEFKRPYDAETVFAVLFHDIGKPYTIQTPERDGVDRIRFNNHDHVGARAAREIASRLRLSSFPKGSRYYIEEESLAWLIEKHLILVQGEVEQMRASTIEKHFLSPDRPGEKLMQLIFCDGMASRPADGAPQLLHYRQLKQRIGQIQALGRQKAEVPAPLVSGKEVMETLKIAPGPEVGKYLTLLREEQLSGKVSTREEAIAFLRKAALDRC